MQIKRVVVQVSASKPILELAFFAPFFIGTLFVSHRLLDKCGQINIWCLDLTCEVLELLLAFNILNILRFSPVSSKKPYISYITV